MEKLDAVASLGQHQLLRPAWIKAALSANDRLKFYLTLLQVAQERAHSPANTPLDLSRDYAAARVDAPWMLEFAGTAYLEGTALHADAMPQLAEKLREDIRLMARPMEDSTAPANRELLKRVDHWCGWLDRLESGLLEAEDMVALTSGKRGGADSFHLLVMDLHKALNRLSADISDETIDGAHVWQLAPQDSSRVAAFMRGLNRTRALKLGHPGLDTAATRDGDRLLLQNDIGTNDAHVLVVQVEGLTVTLTYSDLHRPRFDFFQGLLAEIGADWSDIDSRMTAGLNAGEVYYVGNARFECADDPAVELALAGIGARIVFLIDWNRARKRLNHFVRNPVAVDVLKACAKAELGHMGWLVAGGEKLIYAAMEAMGGDYFRIGDRLDTVMGEAQARDFLIEALSLASQAMQQNQPTGQIADSTRLLLARYVGRHRDEFALLGEHAAYCHALAEGLRDALAHGLERDADATRMLAERAKLWERKADMLVTRLREQAERNPRWEPFMLLIGRADDVADALEEAAFLLSLIAENHRAGWHMEVREAMRLLADKTLEAVQDHVKALAVAGTLGEGSTADDHREFIAVTWRVLNAEQQCDLLLRSIRRALIRHVEDARTLTLATDFAAALELASDGLLRTVYTMRDLAFDRLGVRA